MLNERKVNNLDFIKIKNFCAMKGTIKRTKTQATAWKKISAKHIYLIKDLYSKYAKNT